MNNSAPSPDIAMSSMKDLYDKRIDKEDNLNNELIKKEEDNHIINEKETDQKFCKLLNDESQEIIEVDPSNPRRGLLSRLFGKIETGSLRAAVFNLTALALGIGCQSIPQQFSRMSFIACFFSFNLCIVATYSTLLLMNIVSKKVGVTDYSKLVKQILGNKVSIFLNIIILFYQFGSFIAYQINSTYTFFK